MGTGALAALTEVPVDHFHELGFGCRHADRNRGVTRRGIDGRHLGKRVQTVVTDADARGVLLRWTAPGTAYGSKLFIAGSAKEFRLKPHLPRP